MTVHYCTRSTLREAYAAVVGLPAPHEPAEFSSLHTRLGREWPASEFSSVQALFPAEPQVQDASAVVPPGWFAQLTWDERRWTGRWGHRVLGLHRVVSDGERYETTAVTFLPTLGRWLAAAKQAYAFAAIDPPAAGVVFGYINTFSLGVEAGDLSEWFKFNFKIQASGADGGLDEITVAANIPRRDLGARVRIQVTAREGDAGTQVTVHTVAQVDLPDGATFSQDDALLEAIERARALSKDTFFSFVTERTMKLMGATDAA
jgi:hypothetical protein